MAQTNINIRIDDNLKQEFDKLCDELGLTMSAAFNIFAKAVVRMQGIPFEISLRNMETMRAIKEANNHKNLYGPYNSVEEAINSMLDED